MTYLEITDALVRHFNNTKDKFAESIKFRKVVQCPGESIAKFALRLRQGAVYCEYDSYLDRMFIEQLLFGLESGDMCDVIISKKPTSFSAAYEIAHSLEATRDTTNEVNNTASSAAIE